MEPILAVHDAEYVNYLQTIFDEWYPHLLHPHGCLEVYWEQE
jgi:hypothetical protein